MKKSTTFLVFALLGACNDDAKLQQEEPGTLGTTREPERGRAVNEPTSRHAEVRDLAHEQEASKPNAVTPHEQARGPAYVAHASVTTNGPSNGLNDPTLQGSQKANRARQELNPKPETRSEIASEARAQLSKLDNRTVQLQTKLDDAEPKQRSEAQALLTKVPAQRKAAEQDLQALESVRAANLERKHVSLQRRIAALDETLDEAEGKL